MLYDWNCCSVAHKHWGTAVKSLINFTITVYRYYWYKWTSSLQKVSCHGVCQDLNPRPMLVSFADSDRMTSFSSPVMMTSLGASFHSSSIMTPSSHKFGRPDSTSPTLATTTTTNSVASSEAARNFLNQFNISHALHPPSQVELRESVSGSGLGVWATEIIPAGSKFGPFLGKWCLEPINQNQAWEVSQNHFNNSLKLL